MRRIATIASIGALVLSFLALYVFGPREAAAAPSAARSAGEKVYSANCATCHGDSGAGAPGTFPPLAANPMVTGPADKVIAIVKNGATGSTTVNGKSYSGEMPPSKETLSNADIANVITYIRTSWGNSASAVTAAQVKAAGR
jgi:mono/diheme cytochrome c family protein